ncbi:F-box protein [Sesamum angolense]|uniref:F-box protein n=1 Tax=Sesamum angolense TaxID=2727404 RepID=A0AAE1WSW0_9LAMI|nr:F-box protein [Sesamum angolense]
MAFVNNCVSNTKRANEEYGMGLVRSTSFGRKRVALSCVSMEFGSEDDCIATTPWKRQCFQDTFFCTEKSALEDLPQEILIRILCGVEHDDLKRLFFVSKAIREAYAQKTVGFQNVEYFGDFNEVEAPNAPKQSRVPRYRLTAKKLADISVALFASGDEDVWPRRDLYHETEMGN